MKMMKFLVIFGCLFSIFFSGFASTSDDFVAAINDIGRNDWHAADVKLVRVVNAYDRERIDHLNAKPDPWTGMVMSFYVPLNHASAYVELALVKCNLYDRQGAISAMRNAINIINSDNMLRGKNASERADKFLEKLRQSSFNVTFTGKDEIFRVENLIMSVPKAIWNRNIQASINTSNAIIAYCESRSRTYQYEADRAARQALQEADYTYYKNTGRDYDPNRRPSYGKMRDEWDYCTKIHTIFGK